MLEMETSEVHVCGWWQWQLLFEQIKVRRRHTVVVR